MGGGDEVGGVVSEVSDALVAVAAENASNLSCRMVMVDVRRGIAKRFPADRARIELSSTHVVHLIHRQAVLGLIPPDELKAL